MFVSKGATSGTTWEVAIVGSSSTSTPTGADNGLTVGYNSAGKTGLGGTLTKGTDVATGGNNLTFSGTGNVGIGTNAPLTKLHIVGTGYNNIINERNSEDYNGSFYYTYKSRGTNAAPTAIKAGDNIGGVVMLGYTGSGYSTTSNTAFFSRATQNWTPTATGSSIIFQVTANNAVLPTFPMIIDQNGNVGIGTVTPICALHVEPTAAVSYNFPARVYFNSSSATLQSIAAQTAAAPVAAFFDGRIDVSGFIESDASALTLSDIRAKNIIGRTNNAKDLEVLKTIKITDYRLKDITLGTKVHKMVIAQEVEKVYPQAVNISDKPKALPTIYNYPKAVTAAGNTVTFTMNTPHHLNAGDIAIIRFKEKEYKLVVTNCKDPKVFNVDAVGSNLALRADLKDAFIYGTEVKDGREVDYDAIAMLNVSATQELARQVEELKKQNAALAIKVAEVDELKTTLADMRGELNKLAGLKMVKTEQIDNNKNGREQGNSK
jgi:hypothetical protein